MTDHEPEDLRRDIARTRADMDQTLAQIEDRVSPSRIKDRQVDRIRGRWDRTREAVMGTSDDGPDVGQRADEVRERASGVGDRAGEVANRAVDGARETPDRVEELTRGNPLAAGIIAFGLGALTGSFLPSSAAERQLASGLREEFEEPLRAELQHAGEEVKDDLRQHAQEGVEETKQTARDATDRTTDEAKGRAEEVRGEAERAADHVQEQRA